MYIKLYDLGTFTILYDIIRLRHYNIGSETHWQYKINLVWDVHYDVWLNGRTQDNQKYYWLYFNDPLVLIRKLSDVWRVIEEVQVNVISVSEWWGYMRNKNNILNPRYK